MENAIKAFKETINSTSDYNTLCSLAVWFSFAAIRAGMIPACQRYELEMELLAIIEGNKEEQVW